jgi:lipoprotein signal peptidase
VVRSLVVLVGAATAVAAVDLAHKALAISERGGAVLAHDRSGVYVAGIAVAAALWAAGVVLTRSVSIALAGGVVLGGGLGNLVSIALWPSVPGVPNPLVAGAVAFNLADVAVVVGLALLVVTTLVFAVRNEERLFEAVRVRD